MPHILAILRLIFYVGRVRADIRGGLIDISDEYFITCLYPKGHGDPDDVEKHFLRSGLLMKVSFWVLVISPTHLTLFFLDILCDLHIACIF